MPPSPSAPPPPASAGTAAVWPSRRALEIATAGHLGAILLFAAWAFGGNIEWARRALSWWGSLAVLLTIAGLRHSDDSGWGLRRRLYWLLPWAILVSLVLISSFNPSFTTRLFEGQEVSVHLGEAHPWLPSTVNPPRTLHELWFSATVYLSAFNLLLTIRRRRVLRVMLMVAAGSTLLLSILGTVQKLAGKNLYFGATESPNKRFFATFIYNNHWGAFMILSAAVTVGLLFHYLNHHRGRDFLHSPAPAMILGIFLMLVTGPVSASRAATGMSAVLVGTAALHGFLIIRAEPRGRRKSAAPAVAALLILLLAAAGGTVWLARDSIRERVADTREQIENNTVTGSRLSLYEDTWRLARQKPVFGWGLQSYGTAFPTPPPAPARGQPAIRSQLCVGAFRLAPVAGRDWLRRHRRADLDGTCSFGEHPLDLPPPAARFLSARGLPACRALCLGRFPAGQWRRPNRLLA